MTGYGYLLIALPALALAASAWNFARAWRDASRAIAADRAAAEAARLANSGKLPPRIPRPPPPGHSHGGPRKAIYVWACSCTCVWDARTRTWDTVPCGRPDFNVAEWERRLAQ